MPGRTLPHDRAPAVCPLLPLHLVPARDRLSLRVDALIEAEHVEITKGRPDVVMTPSNSGKGQKITRCPGCHVALWSNYSGAGDLFHFVRVGALDQPDLFPPDIHIFTTSKQPWVILPDGVPVMPEFYERKKYWPAESLARGKQAIEKARR